MYKKFASLHFTAGLVLLACLGAALEPASAGAGSCTNATTRFLGLPATNCLIPPVAIQMTNPIAVVMEDGFPNSYLKSTLSNVPPGYSVSNGVYLDWCVDYHGPIPEPGPQFNPIFYPSSGPLPAHLANTNWGRVNYILNHKQGGYTNIQAAIWHFIGGPIPAADPVFAPANRTAATSNMIAAADAYGADFVPGPGEVMALILDLGPNLQMNIIEVVCIGPIEICIGGHLTLCTANTGSAPLSYMWFKNGAIIPGASGECLSLSNLTAADTGAYCIRVSNACSAVTNCLQLNVTNNLDSPPPVIVCAPNRTFQCTEQVPPLPDLGVVTATDNSGMVTLEFVGQTVMPTNGCEVRIVRTYKATDSCNNVSFCSHTIIVHDTIAPVIACPADLLVPNVASIPACAGSLAQFRALGGTASDNCDTNLEYHCADGPLIGGNCGGFIVRTHTVIDDCANAASCMQIINIATTIPPTLTCPPNLQVQCLTDLPACATTLAQFLAMGGSVTGSNLVYFCSDSPLVVQGCGGLINRTHSVIDACTNISRCVQIIAIRDTIPPTLVCPQNLTVECGTQWTFDRPTATDNCSGTNVSITILSTVTNRLCGNTFAATRTWQATDACTNTATCSQTITIVDTLPPVLACGIDLTIECGTSWSFTPPTAIDGCDGTTSQISILSTVTNMLCGNTYRVVRTYKAADACNNMSTNSQIITLVDTTPPALVCGSARTVECGTAWTFDRPTANDICDGTNVTVRIVSTSTNALCGNTFRTTRLWEAVDQCGNTSRCSQVVTVVDTTPPVLVGVPGNETYQCMSDVPPAPVVTAMDLCDGTNVQVSAISGIGIDGCAFLISQSWTAIDQCSNSVTRSRTITVRDTIAPQLVCGKNKTVECGTEWNFDMPDVRDNCDPNPALRILSTVTNALCGRTFAATRTWEALDQCTNRTTCSQTITVADTTPPSLICGKAQTLECGTTWMFAMPNATDICDGTNLTLRVVSTVTNGLCGQTFAATRTWEALDQCTNRATCSQTITVVDTTPPALSCWPDISVECGTAWNFLNPLAFDLCDGTNLNLTVVSTVTNLTCGKTFTVTRVWKATDACTNSATCSQTIRIVDTTPPVLAASTNFVVECGTPWTFTPPTATDLCDGPGVPVTIVSTTTNNTCGRSFIATRTYKATDACGNMATSSQTVTVIDTQPPILLNVPASTNYECLANVPALSAAGVSAMDNCDTNITITATAVTNGTCPTTIVRTWKASDSCSNMASASQIITVIERPPFIVTAPHDVRVCSGGTTNFCVVATNACPLTYQWLHGATVLPGQTNACLTLTAIADQDQGQYCVVVRSPCFSMTACANLTLLPNVPIPKVPTPGCLVFGTNLVICPEVNAPDGSYSCVWSKIVGNTTNLVSTVSNCCLVLNNYSTADAGEYLLEIVGPCNTESTRLVLPTPRLRCDEIPVGCVDMTNCVGTFSQICGTNFVAMPGVAYTFQWFKVVSNVTNILAGETNNCLTRPNVTAADAGFYVLTLTSTAGGVSLKTDFCGTITVLTNLIPHPLTDVVSCGGASAQFCTETFKGTKNPVAYQWYRNGQLLLNETNACYFMANVTPGMAGQYCVVVKGPCNSVTNCGMLTVQGAIGDFVWDDLNFNGVQDAGEPGISNVVVQLLDCANSNILQTTATDGNGLYLFTCVSPGSYFVRFVPPAGWFFTMANIGNDERDSDANRTNGLTECITITGGETNRTVDSGLVRPAAVGDFVWYDSNTNGLQDVGELGIANVTVKLMDCLNTVIATTNTDANGFYLFTGLAPGGYRVMFNAPAGHFFTTSNLLPDDRDSDANMVDGMTQCYTLVSGETNRTVDAGLYLLTPKICVTKEIACFLPGDLCGTFGKTATGYKNGTDYPAFCYAITVINCGAYDLTNVTVIDDKLGDMTTNFFNSPSTIFAKGSSVTRYLKMAWTVDTTNTVDASGRSVIDGRVVTATDNAIAFVDVASIHCESFVTSPDDQDGNADDNHVLLPPGGNSHMVTFTTIICNDGHADLAGLTANSPTLLALGCNLNLPAYLAAGACYTNICTVPMTCAQVALTNVMEVTAKVDTRTNRCGYDIRGTNITVRTVCSSVVECVPAEPCIRLTKRADRTNVSPGGAVTYTYTVTNCGTVTLTGIVVTDDNGTPDVPGDDFVVGMIPSLTAGASMDLTKTVLLPLSLCGPDSSGNMAPAGMLMTQVLPDGNLKVTFVQNPNRNDNTYGVNSVGWKQRHGEHRFKDLVNSDHAVFTFQNKAGNVVLKFMQDYITASAGFPSGYGCLGVTGGDGGMIVGNAASVLDVSSSLEENVNKQPFLGKLAQYTVDSPAPSDPNYPLWETRMIYTCTVDKNVFGPSGFGSVAITDQHNSPPKNGPESFMPMPCDSCVTNIAVVIGKAGEITVTDSDLAVVCTTNTPCNPALLVTETCQNATSFGGSIAFSGMVRNTGDTAVNDITVTHSVVGLVKMIPSLAPGASMAYSGSFTPAGCSNFVGTVTASGKATCNGNALNVTATASTTCSVPCPLPCLDVIKQIACLLPGDQCGSFGKSATGYRSGTNLPAFCYSITVSNCGIATLTNLVVNDNQLGNLTATFFASPSTPLPIGGAVTKFFKLSHDADATNIVTVTGKAAATGSQSVSDTDSAVAYIDTASISCEMVVSTAGDEDGNLTDAHAQLSDDGLLHTVTFTVVTVNTGDADLANVRIDGSAAALLGCPNPAPFNLPAHTSRTNVICVASLTCTNLPLVNGVTVTAEIDRATGTCAYDLHGSNITVQTTCEALVECMAPGACRVTGGGRQDTTWPPVRYMTHGGQVGAPVGTATTFDPDSACIHGNWEHVRHEQGGSKGNFHAKGFDSLLCACLACLQDPGSGVVIGGLCNPGARTCGPEPRRAPANKICFSGVGDFAESKGGREPRSVIFRVDIEDRSEPGNSHAGGGTPPADRHRIRIWILTDAELAKLNNTNDRLLDFRRAIACTPANTVLEDGAVGPNGFAVPLGTPVFGVRPPDIDDGGEMTHGNHQIHPSIKDCP